MDYFDPADPVYSFNVMGFLSVTEVLVQLLVSDFAKNSPDEKLCHVSEGASVYLRWFIINLAHFLWIIVFNRFCAKAIFTAKTHVYVCILTNYQSSNLIGTMVQLLVSQIQDLCSKLVH